MQVKRICFNEKSLPAIIWEAEKPIAILQITHGMTEHINRYEKLAEECTKMGILVAGYDLRGHGQNSNSKVATFGENGWNASLEDMHIFYEYLEKEYPDLPHFMLGFSLGSFLLREYLGIYQDKIAGAIIMGTGHQPSAILSIMMSIVNSQIKKNGFDNTTPLVEKLSFETYNQKFQPNQTRFDWLCSDTNELKKYEEDPLCKESISSGLFYQLLNAMKKTGNTKNYTKWNKNIPILLLSGDKDPVGDFGKGVLKVKQQMESNDIHLEMHLFKDARHDLLHEESLGCAHQARNLIQNWIISNS